MDRKKEKIIVADTAMNGAVVLLRVCTVLLAGVSFWATAQGMIGYVFHEEWQAYAASFAIQGILLGLNFYYPTFWHQVESFWKKAVLFMLTAVVVFCSSWFSFIFIVEQAYGQSWDVESRLLIQSTYRRQLYAASDYAKGYKALLADELADQIMSLYSQAKELSDEEFTITGTIQWEEERNIYTGSDFAARSEMLTIINAVESALKTNSSANEQERAIEIVIEVRNGLENSCKSYTDRIADTNTNLTVANENLQAAQRSLNAATEETNSTSLITAVERAQEYLESQQVALQQLQDELTDYQEALGRVQFYEINLGLLSDGTANLVSASLRNIQQELFREEPDLDSLETQAVSVFQVLQATVDLSIDEGEKYQELLNSMNRFINNLREYSVINESVGKFDELMDGFRDDAEMLVNYNQEWKNDWSQRLDGLKSQIAALPAYVDTENIELLSYDRALASDALDEMIRLYIADHNAAQQGIIYLFSPYWELAVFSLILAFFIDLSAFVTGVLIEIIDYKKYEQEDGREKEKANIEEADVIKPEEYEPVIPHPVGLNRYMYLNGDYIHEERKNIYRAIVDGQEVEICLPEMGLKAGLYVEENQIWIPVAECKKLRLILEPQDGVYQDCILRCDDYALSISERDSRNFCYLASITKDVSAYILENDHVDIMPAYLLKEKEAEIVVVALNQNGTAVISVYFWN